MHRWSVLWSLSWARSPLGKEIQVNFWIHSKSKVAAKHLIILLFNELLQIVTPAHTTLENAFPGSCFFGNSSFCGIAEKYPRFVSFCGKRLILSKLSEVVSTKTFRQCKVILWDGDMGGQHGIRNPIISASTFVKGNKWHQNIMKILGERLGKKGTKFLLQFVLKNCKKFRANMVLSQTYPT